ncbi:MAG: hypothetical protein ACR2JC_03275 [Chloroflexota bacterium]|nr:MAG: hypothetical protein DLM70_18280 [Chloroflexota bacterium]
MFASAAVAMPPDVKAARLHWSGSGQAFVLQSLGETAVIGGSGEQYGLLERLGELLQYRTRTLDLVVVTDDRAANLSGLEGLVRHYRIREVLDVGLQYPSLGYAQWRDSLGRAHIPVYALRTGTSITMGTANLTAIGPDGVCGVPADCAGMMRITVPKKSYLITGDASQKEQREALFRPVKLSADVLLGDGTHDFLADFVRAVHPQLVETYGTRMAGGTRHLPNGLSESL